LFRKKVQKTADRSRGRGFRAVESIMPSDEGTLDTLAPGEGVATLEGPPIVRAGAREDLQLVAVDPAHYAVGKEIAKGGMGRILEARDRRLGRTVAIKELLVDSADARVRFEREARITARLQHPSIDGCSRRARGRAASRST
jgi:serine/threonine protein kinase